MPRINVLGISLNPGPFTIKEHVLITIMAGVGATSAYAVRTYTPHELPESASCHLMQTDVIAVQRVFYDQHYNFICQLFRVSIRGSDSRADVFNRPMDGRNEHPVDWLLRWRYSATILSPTTVHEWVFPFTAFKLCLIFERPQSGPQTW